MSSPLLCASYSHYAQCMLDAHRVTAEEVSGLVTQLPLSVENMAALIESKLPTHHDAEQAMAEALRKTRVLVMLAMMEFDLSNPPTEQTLDVITQTVSALADASTLSALDVAYRALTEIHGEPRSDSTGAAMPLWVMGMGKLSGRELNVSSDMDLVFVFEHEGETVPTIEGQRVRALSHGEFFDRLGRRMIKLLDDVNEFGFVFRVDMRLRPNGASGALCVSLSTLEKYLFTQARTWERFVWLKSRLMNPSSHSYLLEQVVTPFVFRRYLDYDAIDALRDVHHKIRAKAESRAAKHPESEDIKIGSGGIREIEFSVQLPQIIKGARLPNLQQKATLTALPELSKTGLMDDAAMRQLREHYVFLRHLEHRIQYLNDAQTQQIPVEPELRERIARTMRFDDWTQLEQHMRIGQANVMHHFNALFDAAPEQSPEERSLSARQSADPQNDDWAALWARFDSPQEISDVYARMETNPRQNQLPERSLIRYKQLVNASAQILVNRYPNQIIPMEWLQRIWNFLDAISRRSSYLALLIEYPKALERLVELLASSRFVADYLTAHPILLDELLNVEQLHRAPDWPALQTHLNQLLNHAKHHDGKPDVERQMDILRENHHSQVFRLLVQELDGLWTVEQLADHLSDLTDVMLNAALYHCWDAFAKKHRDVPKFAIIAYGKLGGKEMGYASDLDLVFVFDDPAQEALEVYSRFAQRLNNWLTAPTGAGVLFDTDYRLRPNGDSGLMVVSTKMFEQYQRESAWFWEHQALTRARYCAGDVDIGAWFEDCRRSILSAERDIQKVRAEISSMRDKLQAGHPNPTELFDLKYDSGGMVDIEFCVQALVLGYSNRHPELLDNKGNIALLERAGHAGLIDGALAKQCGDAYRHYRHVQHTLRMQNIAKPRVVSESVAQHIEAVNQLYEIVLR